MKQCISVFGTKVRGSLFAQGSGFPSLFLSYKAQRHHGIIMLLKKSTECHVYPGSSAAINKIGFSVVCS